VKLVSKFNEFEVDDHPSLFCDCGLPYDTCVCKCDYCGRGFGEEDFERTTYEVSHGGCQQY